MKAGAGRAIAVAVVCLTGGASAQQNAVIRTETRVVLVDTIVTDKQGEYVHGLAAKDFRVWEDNKEQAIKSVTLESGAIAARPRYLVLFFAPMEAEQRIVARQAVSGFIDANTEENRRMAVVSYNGGLRIGQNFTGDADRLKAAVDSATSSETTTGISDTASFDTIRALGSLARNLSALPGRKMVVLVNSGLSQSSSQKAELTATIDACNKSDVAVYPIDLRSLTPGGTFGKPGRAIESNGTGYPVGRRSVPVSSDPSPRGAVAGPQGDRADSDTALQDAGVANQQVLFRLANGTGGFVIPNSGQLQVGLQKIGTEQTEYYVLSYTPGEASPDSKPGKCHTLRVKVDRGGTTVRARADYCESKPQDLLAGTIAGQDLERRAASAQAGTIGASMELSHFYVSSGVARVHLAMEILPDGLKFPNQKNKAGKAQSELNFLGIASTADGGTGARFSDALQLDSESAGKALHYEKEFRIAPGRYNFTMAFSSGGESFGKLEMPLTVEPWQAAELSLSGLALSKETHPAAELGLGTAGLVESSTPLVANDVQIVPSGSNQFTKSENGFVYFEVYAPDPASVRVTVRVLDRKTGDAKAGPNRLKLSAPKDSGAIPAGFMLPVEGLATGSYELEVTAVDMAGKQIRRTVEFEVR
jgi:VWFA-related protein